MEFFKGFRWAVHAAFSESVAQCRFQEGDTLYDTRNAYEYSWGEAQRHIEFFVQIRRSSALASPVTGDSGSSFSRNWNSEIFLDLWRKGELVGGQSARSTQGRLYTLLWKGDVQVLDINTPAPPIPVGYQETTRLLLDHKECIAKLSEGYALFAMPYDPTSSISRSKYLQVRKAIERVQVEPPFLLNAIDSGLPNWESIAPTVVIAVFRFGKDNCADAKSFLKQGLYTPAEGAKKEMFRLTAHGLLIC